jgi:16S rRNA (cytosine1402-N4)-methyltransferase
MADASPAPDPAPKKKRRPFWRKRVRRSTAAGAHVPVLLAEVLRALDPRPGHVVADCTLGFAGHAAALLERVGPTGLVVGIDLDPGNLEPAREKLSVVGHPFHLHHGTFADLWTALGDAGHWQVNGLLADLGMSSMQVDDRRRGFSFMRDGPLDMRMDPTRGRTAADLLNTLPADELAAAFRDLGDEPKADAVAAAVVAARPVTTTAQLRAIIDQAAPVQVLRGPGRPPERKQLLAPATRVFQALRMLVNRERPALEHLLRTLPQVLAPGGVTAVISFHSGEDRLVKAAFRAGRRAGVYSDGSDDPIRPTPEERQANPRSRSAKLRWVRKA